HGTPRHSLTDTAAAMMGMALVLVEVHATRKTGPGGGRQPAPRGPVDRCPNVTWVGWWRTVIASGGAVKLRSRQLRGGAGHARAPLACARRGSLPRLGRASVVVPLPPRTRGSWRVRRKLGREAAVRQRERRVT